MRFALAAWTALLLAAPSHARDSALPSPLVAGWTERVTLTDMGLGYEAKLDTGADTSSINAQNISRFTREGRPLVRFDLVDDAGKATAVEAPLARETSIKRAGKPSEKRAVVRLAVCVAGHSTEAEFTVADRSGFDYQVLIGRSLMAGRLIVDPGRQRLASDKCPTR